MVSGNVKIDYTTNKKVTCSAIFAPMSSDYYQLRELDGYDVKYDCSRAKTIKFLMIE